MTRPLHAVTLYPLAGIACGDDANATALARRAARRGLDLVHRVVQEDERVPDADLYLLGGRGTAHLPRIVERLAEGDTLARRVHDGAVVLAVDSGLDAMAHGLRSARTPLLPGLGLLDVTTVPSPARDGAVVTAAVPDLGLPCLTGWVQTDLGLAPGPGYRPFATLEVGAGDVGTADGVVRGHVLGTRLHGPLAAVNPEVADLLLAWATGREPHDLPAIDDDLARAARSRRISGDRAAARRSGRARATSA